MNIHRARGRTAPARHERLRFGAILGTMDDVDILPATLAHLRAIGVERIVVLDFGSTDGSLEVLAEAESAGDLWLLHPTIEDEDDDWFRARVDIGRSLGVDRILYLDADEFVLPAGGSLHDIEEIRDTDILSVPRFNVVLGPDGPMAPATMGAEEHARILLHAAPIPDLYHHLQAHPDDRWLEGQLEPKVIARPEAVAWVHIGTHEVDAVPGRAWRRGVASQVMMAHLPFRSYDQFEQKSINVSRAVAQDPGWFTGSQGWQWVRWSQMHAQGRTRQEYERQVVQPAELPALRASGRVRSVAELLARPIPVHPTAEDMAVAATRSQPWIIAAGIACRREGIDIDSFAEVIREGQHPTVRVPPGHIVKLFGPWREGEVALRSEVDALRLARRDPTLEVPQLVGHGMLDDRWGYVVQGRLAGESLSAASAHLSPDAWLEVATWVGRFLRRLHALPVGPDDTARPVEWLEGYLRIAMRASARCSRRGTCCRRTCWPSWATGCHRSGS